MDKKTMHAARLSPPKDILRGYADMKDKNDIRIKWLVDFD